MRVFQDKNKFSGFYVVSKIKNSKEINIFLNILFLVYSFSFYIPYLALSPCTCRSKHINIREGTCFFFKVSEAYADVSNGIVLITASVRIDASNM